MESIFNKKQFELIDGDLLKPETFDSYLASSNTVLHLAAATGKAGREECFKVNSGGTRTLVRHCEQKGVNNFLHVSTIAVKFADKSQYYYAKSKELAEQHVKESHLNYMIVRPTIVIGKNGAVWKALLRLANKPILIVPGTGSVRVQPIHIDDLVQCLLDVLNNGLFNKQTIELGGSEAITLEELLERIQIRYRGKGSHKIHIPVKPLMSSVALLEKLFSSKLPFTSGQLSAFCNDSTIDVNQINSLWISQTRSIDRMIQEVSSA